MINLNETIQNINQNISQTITELSKNYLINGSFLVAQRANSSLITAGTAVPTASLGYPVVDSWYAYSVGGNPTLAQVNSNGGSTPYYLQLTGASGITSFGIGQRIEAINSASLALKTVTLSFECSNSLLTSISLAAYRPSTTANTFGTIGTPTKTLISNTSININNTLTRYSWTFTCPQEVDKGLEIVFTGGNQVSGTFILSNVKLEEGTVATPFTVTSFQQELVKCQRYYQKQAPYSVNPTASFSLGAVGTNAFITGSGGSNLVAIIPFVSTMFTNPTVIFSDAIGGIGVISSYSGGAWYNSQGVTAYSITDSCICIASGVAIYVHLRYQAFAYIP